MKILLLFFIISSLNAAPEDAESPFEYTKRIHEGLERIKKLDAKDYFKNIDQYRTNLERYIEHKKRVCEGEFSTIILSGSDKRERNVRKRPNKLSREERKLCFRELKALQSTFINNMFIARKKYLTLLHSNRMKQLEKARDLSLKSLNSSFSKKKGRR